MQAGGEIRLGEVLAALTYALDLAEGQAAGHALRTCLIGMTLAERLGLDTQQRSELYYAHLLKDAGCSSNASRVAALLAADDQAVKRELKLTDWTRFPERVRHASRVAAAGASPPRRLARLAVLARHRSEQREFTRLRCERGGEIAAGLGFPIGTADAIRSLDEHWDGSGHPRGLRRRGDPARRAHHVPRADRRRVPHRAWRGGSPGDGRGATRPLVRSRAGRRARRRGAAAACRRTPTSSRSARPRTSRASSCWSATTTASARSPTPSRS